MKEKLWKRTIYINLILAALVYLPILIPFSTYITAYSFLFQFAVLHLLIVTVMLYSIHCIEE
ncbi:hypothetical protein [Aminipila sp.]|uniref:hypothetical protein n=1 Tax=Aminipila sp. TaxID=2060095 RepID=UPI001DC40DEC|nr:hypothetical protein [Aminipila sp.]MBE6033311.1 hypothetical protein [Clostridiales bacterium]